MRRILLVERHTDSLEAHRASLERHGYEVSSATSQEEALERLQVHDDIGLAITELSVEPGSKNGSETVDTARRIYDASAMPMLFLVDRPDQELTARVRDIPNCGMLPTDSDAFVFLQWVRMALGQFEDHTSPGGPVLQSSRELASLMDNLPGMAYRCLNDPSWTMRFVSHGAFELTEYRPEDLIDNRNRSYADLIHPEDRERVWQSVQKALEEHRAFEVEYRIQTASGAEKYVWEQGTGVYVGGAVSLVEGFVTEITGRKRAERRLQHAMAEKDNLMKELNHRVKNNLKMVSSLVSLKDMALGDGVDLSDIKHQIEAIQIVHQKLHESGRITHIQVRDYIEDLLHTIFSSFAARAVHIDTEIEEIALPTKQAIPLGLIINEMATNAIKHGFTDQGEARFSVSMSTDEHGDQLLIVSNSGRPFPADIDLNTAETLGLQLIRGLVEQLAGSIELQRSPEPKYTVHFPVGP